MANAAYCIKCSLGYTGIVSQDTLGRSYIASCSTYSGCKASIIYTGLPSSLSNLVSCHACQDPTAIPFIALDINMTVGSLFMIKGIKPWSIKSSNFSVVTNSAYSLVQDCYNPLTSTDYTTALTSGSLPADCALGVFNTASTDGDLSDSTSVPVTIVASLKLAAFCGACLPGYSPQYLSIVHPHIVVSCTKIPFCSATSQTVYNKCRQCEPGYSFSYLANLEPSIAVDLTQCHPHTDTNCFAF